MTGTIGSSAARSSTTLLPSLVLAILRNAWRAIITGLIGAVVGLVLTFVIPNSYTAEASFIPDAGSSSSLLGGLVGQFVGLTEDQLSPRLAGDLVKSTPIMKEVLYSQYPIRGGEGITKRLIDMLPVSGSDSAHLEYWALRRLRSDVDVDVDERTGVVDLYVELRDPWLSAAVANDLVTFVDRFNTDSRQSRARATRQFLEARTTAAKEELQVAESTQERFAAANRQYQSSPWLTLIAARLQREVDTRQQVYLSLDQQYEQARVDEVKNTPILTRVAVARPPVKRSFPRPTVFVIFGFFFGGIGALVVPWAAVISAWYREVDQTTYAHWASAWGSAVNPLRRLVRLPPRQDRVDS